MDKLEHNLRKGLRAAIEDAMTATLDIGEAVEVATMAAQIYATAVRSPEKIEQVYVVSWPIPDEAPMRQAKGFTDVEAAQTTAQHHDGAEIFILEIVR